MFQFLSAAKSKASILCARLCTECSHPHHQILLNIEIAAHLCLELHSAASLALSI